MEQKRSSHAWKVIVTGLALEILIALVAVWVKATGSCGSCGAGSPAGVAIGTAGVVFYAALLGMALWLGPTALLFVGIFAGFVVHAALLFLMLSGQPLCPPCIMACGVSTVLFLASMFYDSANLRRAAYVLPITAILLQAGSFVYGLVKASALAEAHPEATADAARRDGRVRLVIFEEPNCPYCQTLERDVLPEIEREFGPGLQVIRRPGSDVPGIALPTMIVVGAEEEVFEGLPTVALLRAAIDRALKSLGPVRVSAGAIENP